MTMQGCCELHQPSAPSGGARRPPRTIAPTLADHGRRQTLRTGRIQIDDVGEGRIKGRSIVGPSPEVNDGVVYFNPICSGAGWRHAKEREIVAHWRKTGRPGGGEEDASDCEQPVAIDGQLSLEDASE